MLLVEIESTLILQSNDCNIETVKSLIIYLLDICTLRYEKFAEVEVVSEGCPHQGCTTSFKCFTVYIGATIEEEEHQSLVIVKDSTA